MRRVFAVHTANGTTSTPSASPVLYEFYALRSLPVINYTTSVKHIVLSARGLEWFNWFTHVGRSFFGLSYGIGSMLCVLTLFTPMPVAGYLAVVGVVLVLVPTVVAFMVLRFDMVVLLVQTYEFWYMTLTNVFVCVLVSISSGGTRWLSLGGVGICFELFLLIDANFRGTRGIILGTILGAAVNMTYVFCTTFGLIRTTTNFTLFSHNGHRLQADEATMNALGTLWILMVRNAYRKHQTTRAIANNSTKTFQCVTYWCRLGLRAATQKSSIKVDASVHSERLQVCPDIQGSAVVPTSRGMSNLAQMSLVLEDQQFDASNVMLPQILRFPPSMCRQIFLFACLIISLASILVTAFIPEKAVIGLIAPLGMMSSATLFVKYAALANRQLLRRLLSSFDFLFLSGQFTATHICIADIVGWSRPHLFAVFASWLLIHWVLVIDTIVPVHRMSRVPFQRFVACAIIVIVVVVIIGVATAVIIQDEQTRLKLNDRIVLTLSIHGNMKHFRVVPILFGRLPTTISWSLRLLWRLWRSKPDELLILHGRVEFRNCR